MTSSYMSCTFENRGKISNLESYQQSLRYDPEFPDDNERNEGHPALCSAESNNDTHQGYWMHLTD